MHIVWLWILRRLLEVAGWVGSALALWGNLPPQVQEAVLLLLGNEWQKITLGALVPIAVGAWGYAWSLISTIRPQVVVDGRQVPTRALPAAKKTMVEEVARTAATAARRPTILGRLLGR